MPSSLLPSRVDTSSWDSLLLLMMRRTPEEVEVDEEAEEAEVAEVVETEVVPQLLTVALREREAMPRRLSRG